MFTIDQHQNLTNGQQLKHPGPSQLGELNA